MIITFGIVSNDKESFGWSIMNNCGGLFSNSLDILSNWKTDSLNWSLESPEAKKTIEVPLSATLVLSILYGNWKSIEQSGISAVAV
jgi:hypothetical protein